jgi:hypothetical protein
MFRPKWDKKFLYQSDKCRHQEFNLSHISPVLTLPHKTRSTLALFSHLGLGLSNCLSRFFGQYFPCTFCLTMRPLGFLILFSFNFIILYEVYKLCKCYFRMKICYVRKCVHKRTCIVINFILLFFLERKSRLT